MANSTKISEYSTTAANNTSIDSIDIDENCPASGINNALRSVLKHQADAFTQGTPIALDQTNNRVGIGTISPAKSLSINTSSNTDGIDIGGGGTVYTSITSAGTDTTIQATNAFAINTNGANERLRINSSGNVGIGTSSPTSLLDVNGQTQISGRVLTGQGAVGSTGYGFAGDGNTCMFSSASNTLQFGTSASERMRIDSSGHVGINNTTPGSYLEGELVVGNSTKDQYINVVTGTGNAAGLCFQDTTGTSIVGGFRYTHSDNALASWANGAERMRIDSSGNVNVGRTVATTSNTVGCSVMPVGSVIIERDNDQCMSLNRLNGNGTMILFARGATNNVGSIVGNTSSVSYNTSSDHRLKENVADMTGAIDRVKQLAPKRFNFIVDADTTVDGFLAHEAQTVVPEAVTGTHNQVETWTQQEIDDGDAPDGTSAGDNKLDGDGNTIPVMQGIDQSKLVPLLTAALKESIAKIETLETEMTALKARVTALEA